MLEATQAARRRDLGRFLRQRRSLLQPSQVGLLVSGRRHVRGLRRSEVAEMAEIGVTWYTMLEQGRIDNVSPRTLDAIAHALRFQPGEREHLSELAAGTFVSAEVILSPPPALLEFMRSVSFGIAFVVSPSFDVVAYNKHADEMFEFAEHGSEPNLLRIMLTDSRMRSRFVAPSYHEVLEQMIGHFRSSYGRFGGAAFVGLIDELYGYEEFARAWNDCALMPPPSERSRIVLRDGSVRDVCVMAFNSFSAPAYTLIFKVPAKSTHVNASDPVRTEPTDAKGAVDTYSRRCLEFGAFLRRQRESIRPEDVGLSAIGRRHARGLRRDEVAGRAGLGVSRYTMLEQGRIGTLPARTLEAIAGALLLVPRERIYLARLAASVASPVAAQEPLPNEDLAEFVRTYPLGLAHFHDANFTMLAWNPEADRFYGFEAYERPNLLEVMAENRALRSGFIAPTWEATLRQMFAHYRFTHASPIAEGAEKLLIDLAARAPDFGRIYAEERGVANPAIAAARFDMPIHGLRDAKVFLLTPAACPSHLVVLKNFIDL